MGIFDETIFSKYWNSSLILWGHHLKIGLWRLKFVYHVQLVVKVRNCNNFVSNIFLWWKGFLILKHRSSLWRYYSKTGTTREKLTSEVRFSTSWNCRRFWSLILLATLQKQERFVFLKHPFWDLLFCIITDDTTFSPHFLFFLKI